MFDGKKFFPYLVFCGQVWPLFIYVRPSVAFELCMGMFWPLLFLSGLAVGGFEPLPLCGLYIMDVCLSYFVSSGFEVNMSRLLIFNFVEAFNLLVCSRREFS